MNKILAIDDDTGNLKIIKDTVKNYIPDCLVIVTTSGKEGIRYAQEEQIDTIILDIMMPEMDGFEVCEILKNDRSTQHIPIIFYSGYVNDSKGIIKGLDSGADVFLEKPIAPAELAAQIRVMLRIKKAEDKLKKEIQKYRIMSETLPDAVVTINLNEEITYISTIAKELFKLQVDSADVKANAFEYLFTKKPEYLRQTLNEVLVLERIKDVEMYFEKKDGTEFCAEVSVSLISDNHHNPSEFIIVIKDITKRKNTEIEIQNYQKNLKSLNTSLTETEEKGRKLIAEYLHDGIGQTLSIARMNLTSLYKLKLLPEVRETLESSSEMINNAIAETRSLTFDLSPPILYELGLISALQWKLNIVEEKYGFTTSLKSNQQLSQLNNGIKILAYRIISELIANIIKHAKASKIEINCKIFDNELIISVDDNGKGFEYTSDAEISMQGGFGLFNIKERLNSVDGSFNLCSTIGKGTQAEIKIPIKDE